MNEQPQIHSAVATTENTTTKIKQNNVQTLLLLEGMSCVACVSKIQKALQTVANVESVQVNLAENTALVSGEVAPQALIDAVVQSGYGAELVFDEQVRREKQQQQLQHALHTHFWQSLIALGSALILMVWTMFAQPILSLSNRPLWLGIGLIVLIIMFVTGGHFYRRAWSNLLKKTTSMDTLITLSTLSAWLYSMCVVLTPMTFPENTRHLYFDAAVMIIGLINFGKMLELKGKQKSSQALDRLLALTPTTAIWVNDTTETEIPLAQVQTGMILRLQTGDRVPVDGIITQGSGWLDENMLTGEPLAVEKQIGDSINAGTLLADGTLLFRAEQVGKHTRLANIVKLVRQAQSSKPEIALLADKIATIFVPAVIIFAILAGIIWYFAGAEPKLSHALIIFTSVIIIACPCALGLATPMSIIAGVGRAAELGILVRNADALQRAAEIDTIVFDKTGTLTQAKPQVADCYLFNGYTITQVRQLAASLEQGASHPLAKAILTFADNLPLQTPSKFHNLAGQGVIGEINGVTLCLGNSFLMRNQNIDLSPATSFLTDPTDATWVFLAIDSKLAGLFAIRDPLREDSSDAIQRLKRLGYRLIILTGDQPQTAEFIAKQVGIDEVVAGVLPEGKAQVIKNLHTQGCHVVMVGDGINDAPALALADVSIAMSEGADIAIETAELTLMQPSINSVANTLLLSKAILINIKQNLFGAFLYNLLCLPLAAGLLYPFWGVLINPMFAAAAMAMSSVTVVLNANRLLKWEKAS